MLQRYVTPQNIDKVADAIREALTGRYFTMVDMVGSDYANTDENRLWNKMPYTNIETSVRLTGEGVEVYETNHGKFIAIHNTDYSITIQANEGREEHPWTNGARTWWDRVTVEQGKVTIDSRAPIGMPTRTILIVEWHENDDPDWRSE